MTEPRKKSAIPWGLALIFVFLLVVLRLSPFKSGSWPKVGDTAPNLNSFPIDGSLPSATNRVVLLDFWASWCGPCALSMPVINEMHQRYSHRGLLVLGVSVDSDKQDMQQFLRKTPVQFTNVHDAFGHLAHAYSANSLPRTYLIGADGKFAAVHEGFSPQHTRNELIAQIESALKAAGK